jgi:hypothetical protein
MKALCIKDYSTGIIGNNGMYITYTIFKKDEIYNFNELEVINTLYNVIGINNIEHLFSNWHFREYFIPIQELRKLKLEKINENR